MSNLLQNYNNQNNLEAVNLIDFFDKDDEKDSLFIVIDHKKHKTTIFIKGIISSKKIVKNLSLENKTEKKNEYEKVLNFLKKEILELVKLQNIIDIGAPTFLNINLTLNKQKDLFSFQNILNEIDLIENFNVKEFNNKFAYINIKYYGKINNIKEKLIENGIDINFKNNEWSARLK